MNAIERLVKAYEFQAERKTWATSVPPRAISCRIDPVYFYMLQRLAVRFGMTRSGVAGDLLECAVREAYFEAFSEPSEGFDGEPGRSVTMPSPEEVQRFLDQYLGKADEEGARAMVEGEVG